MNGHHSSSTLTLQGIMLGPNAYKSNAQMNLVSSCWSIHERKILLNNSWFHYRRISFRSKVCLSYHFEKANFHEVANLAT